MVGNNSRAAVGDCTLEDIDTACLDFQRIELLFSIYNTNGDINTYVKKSFDGISIPMAEQVWFNCALSEDQLCSEAVDHIRGKF